MTKPANVYIHVCIRIYDGCVYIRVLLCRMAWKLEIPKISHSVSKNRNFGNPENFTLHCSIMTLTHHISLSLIVPPRSLLFTPD